MEVEELRKLLMESDNKLQILANIETLSQYSVEMYELVDLINEFCTAEEKEEFLDNAQLTKTILKLRNFDIINIAKGLESDEAKRKIIDIYSLSIYEIPSLISTFSDNGKTEELQKYLSNEIMFTSDKIDIIRNFSVESLCAFFRGNKELCLQNGIEPYNVVLGFDSERQLEVLTKLEDMGLTLEEKLDILARLKPETKEKVDTDGMPEIYQKAINMKTTEDCKEIIVDLESDLEQYRGLDSLIKVNPEEFAAEKKERFLELCKILPNLKVTNTVPSKTADVLLLLMQSSEAKKYEPEYCSTVEEYLEAEEWIENLIATLKPDYSDIQKLALINSAIGKKISYSPDFDTEVSNNSDYRALWKIISSGYGVCNGISRVEQYILSRVGIESELVDGNQHTFLRIKGIEIPLANGGTEKGDTLVDPTWDLAANRFGSMPRYFCLSYEQIMERDKKGYHENDTELKGVTLGLEEQALRDVFKSIGLTDRDGVFLVKDFKNAAEELHKKYESNPEQEIMEQLKLMESVCPEFADCQHSTINFLKAISFRNLKLDNPVVVKRVYDRSDARKSPHLYVYANIEDVGKRFYVADRAEGRFVEMEQEEFEDRFECYDKDLKRDRGHRPWEDVRQQLLETRSEEEEKKVIRVASDGEER